MIGRNILPSLGRFRSYIWFRLPVDKGKIEGKREILAIAMGNSAMTTIKSLFFEKLSLPVHQVCLVPETRATRRAGGLAQT
jgi:hypothetical protein